MKLLIVAATELEIPELLASAKKNDSLYHLKNTNLDADILITGVGMMRTAFHCGNILSRQEYDFALNAGICGSFQKDLEISTVLEISEESLADLGAEDGEEILDIYEMKLADPDEIPFTNGKLVNRSLKTALPPAKSITVNRALGNNQSIQQILKKYKPDIVNMEGAAFFYACLQEKIPFTSIRSISNYVEPRNKKNWNIQLAVKNLNKFLLQFLEEMKN